MTLIIGLAGKARYGKGSVVQIAQILLQTGDDELEVRQVSFAAALKAMAVDLILLADNKLAFYDYTIGHGLKDTEAFHALREMATNLTVADLKAKTSQARMFLQYIGTEAFRVHVDDLYWVKKAAESISKLPEGTKVCFVPDVRFPNEADFIRNELGGEVWRIERFTIQHGFDANGKDQYQLIPFDNNLTSEQKAHPSETALDDYRFDRVLRATDMETSGDLFSQVKREVERLKSEGKI